MAYTKVHDPWHDANNALGGGDTSTPLTAAALDALENGIAEGWVGPTVFVAASNASANELKHADYVCDGVADDVQIAAAIQSATASGYGGKVVLSSGQFSIASPLTLPATFGFQFVGQGREVTQIRAASAMNGNMVEVLGNHAVVGDLTLDGNKAQQASGNGIFVTGAKLTARDLNLTNVSAAAISVSGNSANPSFAHRFHHLFILNPGAEGVLMTSFAYDTHMIDVWIGNAATHGVYTDSGTLIMTSCHVWGCEGEGVYLHAGANNQIIGSYIETNGEGGSGGRGIRTGTGSDGTQVVGCFIWKNSSGGIYLFGSAHCVVSGNVIKDNGGAGHAAGLILEDCQKTLVADNQFFNQNTTNQGRPFVETGTTDYSVYQNNYGLAGDHFTGAETIIGANSVSQLNAGQGRIVYSGSIVNADISASAAIALSKLAAPPTSPNLPIVGDYYGPQRVDLGASSTPALTGGNAFWTPMWLPVAMAIDQVGVWLVTNGSAGSTMRFGIWANSANNKPGTLIADLGAVSTAAGAGAIVAATAALTIGPGWVWLGCAQQGAPATGAIVRRTNAILPPGSPAWYGAAEATLSAIDGYTGTGFTGGFASSPTVTASRGTFNPTIVVRAA